jgi:hypothetical protein
MAVDFTIRRYGGIDLYGRGAGDRTRGDEAFPRMR